jgi:hypothetical protein
MGLHKEMTKERRQGNLKTFDPKQAEKLLPKFVVEEIKAQIDSGTVFPP